MALLVKKSGIDFACIHTKAFTSACICFGFKAGNAELDSIRLSGECDESIVYQTLFRYIKNKLKGDVSLVSKTKITKICAKIIDGEMLISITCAPAYSALRKITRIVLKELKPISYKLYSEAVKEVGLKPSDDYYNSAINTLTNALQHVDIVLTGRTSIYDDKKLLEFADYVTKGYKACAIEGKKSKAREEKLTMFEPRDSEGNAIVWHEIKTDSPIVSSLLKDFIEKKLNIKVYLKDNKVMVKEKYAKKLQMLSKSSVITPYIKMQLKIKDALEVLIYYSADRCRMNTTQLVKAASMKLKEDSLVSSFEKALK